MDSRLRGNDKVWAWVLACSKRNPILSSPRRRGSMGRTCRLTTPIVRTKTLIHEATSLCLRVFVRTLFPTSQAMDSRLRANDQIAGYGVKRDSASTIAFQNDQDIGRPHQRFPFLRFQNPSRKMPVEPSGWHEQESLNDPETVPI